jgi:hypothetical protein
MLNLDDLIRQINRDMEEHRRQVEASQRALAEQCTLIAEQEGWLKRYCPPPLMLAVLSVIGLFLGYTTVAFLIKLVI